MRNLSFVARLRAHSAGQQRLFDKLAVEPPGPADALALAEAPLALLAAAALDCTPADAAVVGVLPVRLLPDVAETVQRARAHRAFAEAEVVDLACDAPATVGALDLACETLTRLLSEMPGAVARIDEPSLLALAAGAGLPPEGAAARLAAHGVVEVRRWTAGGAARVGELPVHEVWEVPAALDAAFVEALFAGERRPIVLVPTAESTGIQLLRATAVARLAGLGPITVIARGELKGPDATLCFGADRIEAELDPPGTMGSRTRAYGEAAIRGAQRTPIRPRRRAADKKVAHILDENVDPSLLPGGAGAALEILE